jgi:hypothetical protein
LGCIQYLSAADKLKNQPNIHFALVEGGKKLEYQSQWMKLQNATFTGPKPKRDMVGILAASDVCLAIFMDIPMSRPHTQTRCSITWLQVDLPC